METGGDSGMSGGERRLCSRLGLSAADAEALVGAMQRGDASRSAVVLAPNAPEGYEPPFPCEKEVPAWLPPRVYLPAAGERPALHADYAAGRYYILDASSCWEGAALGAVAAPPARSLDLCAAPGGKSMLLGARFGYAHAHTANEVSAARRGVLRRNLLQCGWESARVTGLRPDQWAAGGEKFDLVLVDAPCSGQSLLAKGIKNPGCLGAGMVGGNAKRQRGIMLAAVRCVAPQGHLLYSTCTYDPEEDERVAAYILKRHAGWRAVEIPALSAFQSTLAPFPAYRLLPQHGFGAGGFCCLLQNTDEPS